MKYATKIKTAVASALCVMVGMAYAAQSDTYETQVYGATFEGTAVPGTNDNAYVAGDAIGTYSNWFPGSVDDASAISNRLDSAGGQMLFLDTDGSMLTNVLASGVTTDVNAALAGGSVDTVTAYDSAYVAAEIKFVADTEFNPGFEGGTTAAKFAIYAYCDDSVETNPTNLVVYHGYVKDGAIAYTNEVFTSVTLTPDTYTRVRVNLKKAEVLGSLTNVFSVSVNDGAPLTSDTAVANDIWFVTTEAPTAPATVSSVAFVGSGEVDNIALGQVCVDTYAAIVDGAKYATWAAATNAIVNGSSFVAFEPGTIILDEGSITLATNTFAVSVVSSDPHKHIVDAGDTYTATLNKYTVTFKDDDNSTISSADYDYGTAAADVVKPADPTKAATDQYTYEFSGWSPAVAEVTGDATYTATYSSTVNKYNVTFVDEDGSTVLKAATAYDYGTTAADIVKPADPTKAATAQYTYTFAGWSPSVANVTADAIYTATYTPVTRSYTITWVDGDGNTLDTDTVSYNETPVYTGTTPTKTETAEYTFEFNDTWSPTIVPAAADATYTAQFTPVAKAATVISIALNTNAVDAVAGVRNGSLAATTSAGTNVTVLAKVGISGAGDIDIAANPNGDVSIVGDVATATFPAAWNSPVEWTLSANDASLVGKTYAKAETGWFTTPASNIVTSAELGFGETIPVGIVPGASAAGETVRIQTRIEVSADGLDEDPDPTGMGDARGGITVVNGFYKAYTGTAWTPLSGATPIDGEVDLLMVADMAANQPAMRYYIDGVALWTTNAIPGERVYSIPLADAANTEDNNILQAIGFSSAECVKTNVVAEYDVSYAAALGFDGYTNATAAVNALVAANKAAANDVTFTLLSHNVGGTVALAAGEQVTVSNAGSYTNGPVFTASDSLACHVVETVNASATTYSIATNSYTVIWVAEGAATTNVVDYGTTTANIQPADPTKDATAQYSYAFAGWTPALDGTVTSNTTYTATFDSTVNQYDVTFVDEDGTTVLKAATAYDYGTAAADVVKPADPTKAATTQYTYTFSGWSPAVSEVTGDATYTATYSSTVNQYNVTFVDEDGTTVLKAATAYDYGTAAADIVKPANPTKAATAQYTYEFTGWTPAIAEVTGDATYTATYSSTVNQYTISWDTDGDGDVDDTTQVAYDTLPTHADGYKAEDADYTYTFAGWTPEVVAVTEAATYTATFRQHAKAATVISIALNTNAVDNVRNGSLAAMASDGTNVTVLAKLGVTGQGDPELTASPNGTATVAGGLANATFPATWNEPVEWTLSSSNATLAGVTYAKAEREWFSESAPGTYDSADLGFGTGVTAGISTNASAAGETVRIQTRIEVTAQGSDEEPEETGSARGGFAVIGGAYKAFNGTAWTTLLGATPIDGEIDLLMVGDMAAATPAMRYYVDGVALYTTNALGERLYSVPLKEVSEDNAALKAIGFSNAEFVKAPIVAEYDVSYVAAMGPYGHTNATAAVNALVAADKDAENDVTFTLLAHNVGGTVALGVGEAVTVNNESTYTNGPSFTAPANYRVAKTGSTYSVELDAATYIFVSEGATLQTTNITIGAAIAYTGDEPTKAATAQYTYAFDGWTNANVTTASKTELGNSVAGGASFYAVFSEAAREYTITWNYKDASGANASTTTQVAYGTTPTAPAVTASYVSGGVIYTLSGWTPALEEVSGETTYTATYSQAAAKATVISVAQGTSYYPSVDAALAIASSGDTVQLLADFDDALYIARAIPSGVTFDPDGHDFAILFGAGTQADPFVIYNATTLGKFRDSVNSGSTYAGQYLALGADITLSGAWTPIGTYGYREKNAAGNPKTYFAGTFDGAGHYINGLTDSGYVPAYTSADGKALYAYGLFGSVSGATITDLVLTNVAISASAGDSVGAIVGFVGGDFTLTGSTVYGSVIARDSVAGLIGRAYGNTIKGSLADIVISGNTNNAAVSTVALSGVGGRKVAGILGFACYYNSLTIDANVNNGDITMLAIDSDAQNYFEAGVALVAGVEPYNGGYDLTITDNVNNGVITAPVAFAVTGEQSVRFGGGIAQVVGVAGKSTYGTVTVSGNSAGTGRMEVTQWIFDDYPVVKLGTQWGASNQLGDGLWHEWYEANGAYSSTAIDGAAKAYRDEPSDIDTDDPVYNFLYAIATASAGDTVTLGQDITIPNCVVVNKAITIDLGGHTITSTGWYSFALLAGGTIQNGVIDMNNTSWGIRLRDDTTIRNLSVTNVVNNEYGKIAVYGYTAEDAYTVTIDNGDDDIIDGRLYSEPAAPSATYSALGGTYTVNVGEPANVTLPENYAAVANGDGTWTVKPVFTVIWVVDGVTVETDYNVPSNSVPTFDGATPTKAGSVFAGWTPAVAAITGNTTYTATWSTAKATVISVADGTTTYYGDLVSAIAAATQAGDTVKLLDDVAVDNYVRIPGTSDIVLDLNGHALTESASFPANYPIIANMGSLVITNGTITTVAGIQNNGTLVIEEGQYNQVGGNTYQFIRTAGNNSPTVTINGGTINALSPVVRTGTANSTINIHGGTLYSAAQAVIFTIGNAGKGGTTIVIDGGTLASTIPAQGISAGYIATGIALNNDDMLTFGGTATLSVTNGVGILVRAGEVTVNGGTIETIGNVSGRGMGDSSTVVQSAAIVYDTASDYPGYSAGDAITISAGTIKSVVSPCVQQVADDGDDAAVLIPATSTALFSDADADGVPAGYALKETGEGTGLYMISQIFIVTYANYDGAALQVTTNFVGDATPAYAGETPARAKTDDYGYSFANWSPAVAATVTADATYTAEFSATSLAAATWVGGASGNWEDAANWDIGYVPTSATVVTFTNDAQVAILSNSDRCKELVLANANVTLVRDANATQPILHFYGNGGSAVSVSSGATGSLGVSGIALFNERKDENDLTIGCDLEILGDVTFRGISIRDYRSASFAITGKTTVAANATVKTIDWGTTKFQGGIEVSQGVTAKILTRPNGRAQIGTGVTLVANDGEGNPTTIWLMKSSNWSGNVSLDSGASVAVDADHVATYYLKTSSASVTDEHGLNPANCDVYEATKKLTVIWVVDGAATTNKVEYGTATASIQPANPTKAVANGVIYTFNGWTPEVAETVTEDATYTAQFTETAAKATVITVVENVPVTNYYPTLPAAVAAATTAGDIVKLLGDVALDDYLRIPATSDITLDLGGYEITESATFTATRPNYPIIANMGTLVLTNGTITMSKSIQNNGTLTVNGGTYRQTDGTGGQVFMMAGNNGPTLTINDGTFIADGPVIRNTKPNMTVYIHGGTLYSAGHAVIFTMGNSGMGGNTIVIDGGTLASSMPAEGLAEGFIATGICLNNDDTLSFGGTATLSVTNGVGILVRGGEVSVTGGVIETIGDVTGKPAGDSATRVSSAAIVYDTASDYPGYSAGDAISITGGTIISEVSPCVQQVADEGDEAAVSIPSTSTALFSDAEADGVPEGYALKETVEGSGLYALAQTFIVTYANYDGAALQVTTNFVDSATPEYTGETPVKPTDASGVYTFTGFAPEADASVTSNATYTAVFSSVAPKATVITVVDNVTTSNFYGTVTAALEAAPDGSTVVVLADTHERVYATVNNNVTLDINGKTMTSPVDDVIVKNGTGTLTIQDTAATPGLVQSTINGVDLGVAVWARQGAVVIKSGVFENNSNYEATVYVSNGAYASIEGGTFRNVADGEYHWKAGWAPINLNVQNGHADKANAINVTGGSFSTDPGTGDDSLVGDEIFVDPSFVPVLEGGQYVVQDAAKVIWIVEADATTNKVAIGTVTADIKPEDPTKDADEQYTYTFTGWLPELDATVTSNSTYVAQFSQEAAGYKAGDTVNGVELTAAEAAWLNGLYGEGKTYATKTAFAEAIKSGADIEACYLLNCDPTVENAGGTLTITAITVGENVQVNVQLDRTGKARQAINGTLKLFGTAGLGTPFAELGETTITDADFSDGDTTTATFAGSSAKFFRAKIVAPEAPAQDPQD